jgi:hypothetical protein
MPMLPTQVVQAIALLCGMVMEVIGEGNKVAAEYIITCILIFTCTPLLLVMLAYFYDPTGGLIFRALAKRSKLTDSVSICNKLGLVENENVERLSEVFEEAIEDGDTSQFEETGAALMDIWRLVTSMNTDPQALEDSLLGLLQSLGISRNEAQEIVLSSVMTAFIRKLEEKGFHQMVISRVEALLAQITESGGGPNTSGVSLDKMAPLGHAMIPLVLGDVSEDNLVAVLRALEFTQCEADALISLGGLTQAHDVALHLGMSQEHESIVLVVKELNARTLAIEKRATKAAARAAAKSANAEAEEVEEEADVEAEEEAEDEADEEADEEAEEEADVEVNEKGVVSECEGAGDEGEDGETPKQEAARLKKEMLDEIIKVSLVMLYARRATEPHVMAVLSSMRVDAETGRKRISSSIRRVLYSIGLSAEHKCMQTSRKLLGCYVSTPPVPASGGTNRKRDCFTKAREMLSYMISPHKAKEKANLVLLLNAAVPMISHPKTTDMASALKLMAALHISKKLREQQLQIHVAGHTMRLLRDVQTLAVRRAEELNKKAQKRIQTTATQEDVNKQDEEGQKGESADIVDEIQELVTPTEVVEWMSAPMNIATDYADHPSDHKKSLVKLPKILLPIMCGYDDTAAAKKVLHRLGVNEEGSAKLLGNVVDTGAGDELALSVTASQQVVGPEA